MTVSGAVFGSAPLFVAFALAFPIAALWMGQADYIPTLASKVAHLLPGQALYEPC